MQRVVLVLLMSLVLAACGGDGTDLREQVAVQGTQIAAQATQIAAAPANPTAVPQPPSVTTAPRASVPAAVELPPLPGAAIRLPPAPKHGAQWSHLVAAVLPWD